jgi:hypothetical protein
MDKQEASKIASCQVGSAGKRLIMSMITASLRKMEKTKITNTLNTFFCRILVSDSFLFIDTD